MGNEFSLEDVLIILQRRILFFLLPVAILAPLGILIIMLLPAKYSSKGLILVESPQVSEDLIDASVVAAQERIQFIRQRVTTRNNLLKIADQYNLFPRNLGLSETERVEQMRSNLEVRMLGGNTNRRRRDEGTVAFTVAYTDTSPQKSYQIASEILNSFQREDNRLLTSAASDTTEFFSEETNQLRQSIDDLERRIAEYKAEYSTALPEHLELHLDTLERASRDLISVQNQRTLVQEELGALEQQLTSYLGAGSTEGPGAELSQLKAQLSRERAVYRDAHPNVQALKDQIRALEQSLAPSQAIQNLRAELQNADSALKEARNATPRDDALVETLSTAMADVRLKLSAQVSKEASSNSNDFLTAQIQGRLDLASNRIVSLGEQAEEYRRTISDMEERIARTPSVERGLSTLTRDRENLRAEYNQVLSKRSEARMRQNLQQRQKGEKLTILENAVRPDAPSSPDRPKLILLALIAAIGAGGMCALGAEALFATIRGRTHISALLGEPPIAIVPYIRRDGEKRFSIRSMLPWRKPSQAAASVAIAAAIGASASSSPEQVVVASEAGSMLSEIQEQA